MMTDHQTSTSSFEVWTDQQPSTSSSQTLTDLQLISEPDDPLVCLSFCEVLWKFTIIFNFYYRSARYFEHEGPQDKKVDASTDPEKSYALGLIDFVTFNTIPNVDETNNKFFINNTDHIVIPVGSYEIVDIQRQ
nr:unnamed protein product [Callosobruchus analis]